MEENEGNAIVECQGGLEWGLRVPKLQFQRSRASDWGLGDRRPEKAIEEDVAQIVYALSRLIANTSEYLRSFKSTLLVRS